MIEMTGRTGLQIAVGLYVTGSAHALEEVNLLLTVYPDIFKMLARNAERRHFCIPGQNLIPHLK